MQRRKGALLAAAAASVLVAAGCSSSSTNAASSSSSSAPAGGGSSTSASGVTGAVTVFAAASLAEAFTTLAKRFERAHPGSTVKLSFGASSDLAEQISQGAPADVFASASRKNMQQVISAGAAASAIFVRNFMEVAVPPSNPGKVKSVADLAKRGVKVALCEPQVPCGTVAADVFKNAKITVKPVTLEPDVKSTLSKVELDEVDAGMVYATDVRAAGSKVKGVVIPKNLNASTEYPIAALSKAPNAAAAKAFVALVLSPVGQAVLTADGFEKP